MTATRGSELSAARLRRRQLWRVVVGGCCWTTIVICLAIGHGLVLQGIGLGVGIAFHSEVRDVEFLPLWWRFVGLSAGLGAVAIAAGVARRWVALPVAVLLATLAGFLAVGLYPRVASIVSPGTSVVERPLPCQCHSGGTCDCPGG